MKLQTSSKMSIKPKGEGLTTMHSKNLLSIGQTLKEKRESQKISLKQIADQTRINISTLQAIEEGQMSAFPVHAYLRGFILAYVKALDLNEKEWESAVNSLSSTNENVHLSEVAGASGPAEVLIEKDMRLTPAILATVILFILGSILVLSNFLSSHKEKTQALLSKESSVEESSAEEKSLKKPTVKKPAPPSAEKEGMTKNVSENQKDQAPSKLDNKEAVEENTLEAPAKNIQAQLAETAPKPSTLSPPKEIEIIVKALEEVRVHYQVDQEKKESILLSEDQFKVLTGKKQIFIQTRHSDLIYIFHNGKDLGLFGPGGKKEQNFSLTITKEEDKP